MACNFDQYGNCEMVRSFEEDKYFYNSCKMRAEGKKTASRWTYRIYAPGVGCCNRCYADKGYFYTYGKEGFAKEIKHLFLPVVGFWRPNGCSLTMKQKSNVCRSFTCAPCNDDNDRKKREKNENCR